MTNIEVKIQILGLSETLRQVVILQPFLYFPSPEKQAVYLRKYNTNQVPI